MPEKISLEKIKKWPKAELHCHLDGSLRLETMLDEAINQGKSGLLPSDSISGLKEKLALIDESSTVEAYLAWFQHSIPLMQSKHALRRMAYELVEDCARENVTYLEVRYAPILHVDEGLSLEEVNLAVLDGLKAGERDFGTLTALIICGLRDRRQSASLRQAELAVAHREKGVVAFDLAGGETRNPPKSHLPAFYFARNNLLNLTIHAGESWGPSSIHQALFYCGAHRIGHGTSLYQDPALMNYVINHQIPLEICPTSNVQTKVVPGYKDHPLATYIQQGVAVTINTDNRLFSRTTLSDELMHIHNHNEVSEEQLKTIVLNGFKYAFLPFEQKKELIENVSSTLNS